MQTSLLPGPRPDACLSGPPASSPPVTSTCGDRQVENDDHIDDHTRGDDCEAPVAVLDGVATREGVHDAPAVPDCVPAREGVHDAPAVPDCVPARKGVHDAPAVPDCVTAPQPVSLLPGSLLRRETASPPASLPSTAPPPCTSAPPGGSTGERRPSVMCTSGDCVLGACSAQETSSSMKCSSCFGP